MTTAKTTSDAAEAAARFDRHSWHRQLRAEPDKLINANVKLIAAALAFDLSFGKCNIAPVTDRRLAELTGLSKRQIETSLPQLANVGYIEIVDRTRGRGTRIAIRTLAELRSIRSRWADAESRWRRQVEFEARKAATVEWLEAEQAARKRFTDAVYSALTARGMDGGLAGVLTARAWADHTVGDVMLEVMLTAIAEAPAETFQRPTAAPADVTSHSRDVTSRTPDVTSHTPDVTSHPADVTNYHIADAVTCDDPHSHQVEGLQGRQDLEGSSSACPAALGPDGPAPARAAHGSTVADCGLCDADGWLLCAHDHGDPEERCPVWIADPYGDDDGSSDAPDVAQQVRCCHSVAANIAEAARLKELHPGWVLEAATGRPEIDSMWPIIEIGTVDLSAIG